MRVSVSGGIDKAVVRMSAPLAGGPCAAPVLAPVPEQEASRDEGAGEERQRSTAGG